ncbi:hypothetical protein SLEP1_g7770 [Rubroshorea leprosula]|uniref:Coatomer subunit zeta n=1 Tax=Rubroshorea leprosula TaxID=152421 RepID=A0AAV5I7T8_9ROSI|nr:hypothetical protein SLEP1_g7770 [Rubroshorea leprosula]
MFENYVVVYKFVQDLHFFVTGGENENEIILATVLQGFFDAVGLLLRGSVDKKEALENLDLILLCLDEIVDGGIILETDANVIAGKVASHSIDAGAPLSEQTIIGRDLEQNGKKKDVDTPSLPRVLRWEDVPVPEPKEHELKIRVHAVILTPYDISVRKGEGAVRGLPLTPGWDAVGEVVAVGPGVTTPKVGEMVAHIGDPQSEIGTYAEEFILPASSAIPIPEELSYHTARYIASVLRPATPNHLVLNPAHSSLPSPLLLLPQPNTHRHSHSLPRWRISEEGDTVRVPVITQSEKITSGSGFLLWWI